MGNQAGREKTRKIKSLSSILAAGVLIVAGAAVATPAHAADAPDGAETTPLVSSQDVSPDVLVTPDKGGTGGACGRLSLNARLHSKQCNPRLARTPIVLSRCTKLAIGVGATAATVAAVTTTPLDWPGITLAGTVTYLGTKFFCEVDFE